MKIRFCQWIGLCLLLLFSACSKNNRYVNVLPADASCVVSAHLPVLIEKSGLSEQDFELWMGKIDKLVKEKSQSQDWALLGKLLACPEKNGINWEKEIYLFMHPEIEQVGLLAPVSDYERLGSALDELVRQGVCKSFIEKENCRLSFFDNGFAVAYNDEAFLVIGVPSEIGADKAGDLLTRWMNASEEKSFISTEGFNKLSKAEGDIKMVASMNMLPQKYVAMSMAGVSDDFLWKGMYSLGAVSFEKGKLVMKVENFQTGDKAEEESFRIADLYKGETSGKFLAEFSGDMMLWLNTTVNGEKWNEVLCQQPLLKEQLKNTHLFVNLEKCITALKGELALGVSVSSRIPEFGLFAEVENDEFLKELAPFQSTLSLLGFQYGVKEGVFSLTNYEKGKDDLLAEAVWTKDSENKLFFLTLDLKALQAIAPFLSSSEAMAVGIAAAYIENIQVYSSEINSGNLVIKAVNKDTNMLKQCVDLVKKMAENQ